MAQESFTVQGKRVVVLGAARSGLAAARLLVQRGADVVVSDQRPELPGIDEVAGLGVALERGGHRTETLTGADLIVCSPGVDPDQAAVAAARSAGVEVIGELELASRWLQGRLIAITGTKGKSTTTTLVGRMLEASGQRVLVSGNIGVPLSHHVDQSTRDTVHVVEASSFQLETTTTFRPWIATWLNVSDDHLDRHRSREAYVGAKARIFANQQPEDWAVVNADDPEVMARSATGRARRVTFSAESRASAAVVMADDWIVDRRSTPPARLAPRSAIRLRGRHMEANALAAAAVSRLAGAEASAITAAFEGFAGLPHVMEPVGEVGQVCFVDDSKATNPAAARCAIESFTDGLVVILGGVFKGGDLTQLRGPLAARARGVVAIGEAAGLVRSALEPVVPVVEAASMREAVALGLEMAGGEGTVLLSPACASFDWFRDYADRGRQFAEEVRRIRDETAMREQ